MGTPRVAFALIVALCFTPVLGADAKVERPRVAAIATTYYHNSHADVIASRMMQGMTLEKDTNFPHMQLASFYMDQLSSRDIGMPMLRAARVPVYQSVEEALTLGTGKLAVDGVLLIAEHGDYPLASDGQIQYPKRRLFAEVLKVFDKSGRSVPVFFDKHYSDNWEDAKWIYDEARRLKVPMMAGSTIPLTWRKPVADVKRGAQLKEIVAISYGPTEGYGFHTLELMQALAERRKGAETGVKSVRWLEGDRVWQARAQWDQRLLDDAIARMSRKPLKPGQRIEDVARKPILWMIEYIDGFRANVFHLGDSFGEWVAAWRYSDGTSDSTFFWTQEARPFMHFGHLVEEIEWMTQTREARWPAERTLLTTGILDALFAAPRDGAPHETNHLHIEYQSNRDYRELPPPPKDRPIHGQ